MATDVIIPVPRRIMMQTDSFGGGSISLKALIASASVLACASIPTQGYAASTIKVASVIGTPAVVAREQDVAVGGTEALAEIRRRTALTWEQLAGILGVTRRSVHSWMSGQAMKLEHQEKLSALLNRVRAFQNKSVFAIKQAILQEHGVARDKPVQLAGDAPIPLYRHDGEGAVATKSAREAKTRIRRG